MFNLLTKILIKTMSTTKAIYHNFMGKTDVIAGQEYLAYHSYCAVSITQQGFFKSLHTSKARTLCTEILVTYLLTYI